MNTRALLLCLLMTPGCGDHHGHDHDHDHGTEATSDHGSEGHEHVAPHGGVLIPIAQGSANVEVLHDADAGSLELYFLDGCAENPLRSPSASVTVKSGETTWELAAVASALTGETVGDTSAFALSSEELKGADLGEAVLVGVELLGQQLSNLALHEDAHE